MKTVVIASILPALSFLPVSLAGPVDPTGVACVGPDLSPEVIELVSTGKLARAAGTVQLVPGTSPFGIAVTADGRPLFDASLSVEGLPEPSYFGPYTMYVAWMATPNLDRIRNLGPVAAEHPVTTRVDWNKTMFMVSAEETAGLPRWTGPLLMVGRSSSARVRSLAGCDIYGVEGMGG